MLALFSHVKRVFKPLDCCYKQTLPSHLHTLSQLRSHQHRKVTFQIIEQSFPTLAAVSWCPSSTYVTKVRMEMTTGRAAQV